MEVVEIDDCSDADDGWNAVGDGNAVNAEDAEAEQWGDENGKRHRCRGKEAMRQGLRGL